MFFFPQSCVVWGGNALTFAPRSDVTSASVHQSQLPNNVHRTAAAANAAALASPQKAPTSPAFAALGPAVAAAARQSVDFDASYAAMEYHAVGPDGKRVVCDWL
jgi:hypothetical protein